MGWTTWRSRFDPRQKQKDFSSSLCVQTGSGAHPASCTMGTGRPFPGAKARPWCDADHSPLLVPRSRMSRSYFSSPHKCSGTGLAFIIVAYWHRIVSVLYSISSVRSVVAGNSWNVHIFYQYLKSYHSPDHSAHTSRPTIDYKSIVTMWPTV
jgi:hypothetical protein